MFDILDRKEVELFVKYKTSFDFIGEFGFKYVLDKYNDMILEKGILPKGPIQVGLNVTSSCNLRCQHCSRTSKLKSDKENSPLFMKKWKNIINKLSESDVLQIFITGGEPLLHPDIKKIISTIKERNILIGLLTNGMLINQDIVDFLHVNFTSPFDYVHLSIDGLYNEYENFRKGGNFNTLVQSIKLLTEKNIRTHAVMVITDKNFTQMWDVYKFCIEHRLKYLKFMPLFEHPDTTMKVPNDKIVLKEFCKILEHYKKNKPNIKLLMSPIALTYPFAVWLRETYPEIYFPTGKFVCPAGNTSCEISIEGNVYPCSYLEDENFFSGNILEKDLAQIWKDGHNWSRIRNRTIENPKCKVCKEKDTCLGGCPASSYYKNKSFNFGDSRCTFLREKEEVNYEIL